MGNIYFIQNNHDGLIKIGYTDRDPLVRFREWKHTIPHKLTLLGSIRGSRSLESYLKRNLFYSFMVIPDRDIKETEWFEPAQPLLTYIEGQCMISASTSTIKTA